MTKPVYTKSIPICCINIIVHDNISHEILTFCLISVYSVLTSDIGAPSSCVLRLIQFKPFPYYDELLCDCHFRQLIPQSRHD